VPLFLYGKSCIMRGVGDGSSLSICPECGMSSYIPGVALKHGRCLQGPKNRVTKEKMTLHFRGIFHSFRLSRIVLENGPGRGRNLLVSRNKGQ